MGISIKQNHLLKLKYSLHISKTVFRIVVLISIDTCITVVLQIYTLKLRESYLLMLKMYSPPPTTQTFKFVNAKGMLFLFQVMAETVLIPQIFDPLFNTKRHFKHTFR